MGACEGVRDCQSTVVPVARSLTHLVEYSGVDHLGHLTVELGHLSRVHVLGHVTSCSVSGAGQTVVVAC